MSYETPNYGSNNNMQSGQNQNSLRAWEKKGPMEGDWVDFDRSDDKNKNKYPIWSQLQSLEDRLHQIYSEGSDFSTTSPSTVTEAEYRMLPFKIVWSFTWIIAFVFISWMALAIIGSFNIHPVIPYLTFIGLLSIGVYFPAYIIYEMKQWVSGGERTTRYYKHINSAWQFTLITIDALSIALFLVSRYVNLEKITEWTKNYDRIGAKYINMFNPDILKASMTEASYALLFNILLLAFFCHVMKKKSTTIQKQRTLEMKANFYTVGDVAEDIMTGKEK